MVAIRGSVLVGITVTLTCIALPILAGKSSEFETVVVILGSRDTGWTAGVQSRQGKTFFSSPQGPGRLSGPVGLIYNGAGGSFLPRG
jgi:hypothetical protein